MRTPSVVALVFSLLLSLHAPARAQAPGPTLGASGTSTSAETPPPITLTKAQRSARRARLLLTVGTGLVVGSAIFLPWSRKPLCDPDDDPGPERADWITAGAGAALGLGFTFGGAFMLARERPKARPSLTTPDVVLLVLLGAAVAGSAAATARGGRLLSTGFCPS